MTDEQRLDRLERIVRLMIKAGLRARKQAREQNEKINILIDSQIRYEERLGRDAGTTKDYKERLIALEARAEEMAARADERFASLAATQEQTERQVQSLASTVDRFINERRNGNM